MRPIDADKLEYKEVIEPMKDRDGMIYPLHYLVVKKTDILYAPTLDVVPAKHGEWIDPAAADCYRCSVCDEYTTMEIPRLLYHYCPNCGAKMDEVEE